MQLLSLALNIFFVFLFYFANNPKRILIRGKKTSIQNIYDTPKQAKHILKGIFVTSKYNKIKKGGSIDSPSLLKNV